MIPTISIPTVRTSTFEEIERHQAEQRAFYDTEGAQLLRRFKNAYHAAVSGDASDRISDKRLREVWQTFETAEELITGYIKKLQDSAKESPST